MEVVLGHPGRVVGGGEHVAGGQLGGEVVAGLVVGVKVVLVERLPIRETFKPTEQTRAFRTEGGPP